MKIIIVIFLSLVGWNQSVSQSISNRIYIENEIFYMVKTGNLNGVLVENHLDSLVNSTTEKYRLIDIKANSRFNNSKINFDFRFGALYSISSYYFWNSYHSSLYKVPLSEMEFIEDIDSAKIKDDIRTIQVNDDFRLAVNSMPIMINSSFDLHKDSVSSILYDLVYVDSSQLSIFVYDQSNNELAHWNAYTKVIRATKRNPPFTKGLPWELTYSYTLDKAPTQNFAAVSMNNKSYLITHEGIVYSAAEKLTEVGKLQGDLENGFVVINKEKGELSYITKNDFNRPGKTMRMLLRDPVIIKL